MRKVIGIIVLLTFLGVYAICAGLLGERLSGTHWALQVVYYCIAGVAWALPLKPLLSWMHSKDAPLDSPDV